jgi:hypothetical protein
MDPVVLNPVRRPPMRRYTIAGFLLLLMPSTAVACYDEHQAGWFNEMPARSWERPEASREGSQGEEMSGLWVMAAGTASLALIAVSFRAYSRARGKELMHPLEPAEPPLALPFDGPSDRTLRVDPGHRPGEPTRVDSEEVGVLCAVATGRD